MRMKNKKWSKPFIEEHRGIVKDDIKAPEMREFLNRKPLYLEIGTGKGGFIVNMAINNPNICFFGIEKSLTCLAITAKKAVEEKLTNVRLMSIDIDKIFDSLPDECFDGIFLNFSDPWHKTKHAKRRLTAPQFLNNYLRILKKSGRLIMKTDNSNLFKYSLTTISESKFVLLEETTDYQDIDDFDVMTEYEERFRELKTPIKRLIAGKEE